MARFYLLLLIAFFLAPQLSFSQCNTGSEPECQCSTAPVLCTVDELDGYMFSMSNFQHPQDGPTPLCPNTPGSVPNNPTWFAFTAWCTDLTLECAFNNCTPVGGSIGVQIAIYEDCSFNTAVACNVAPADCNTNNKTLVLTGLNIGDVYYFLVDGCFGSYCDVTIDVIGVCGNEEIAPWTLPVTGEATPCAGNPETYSVEDLDGAATYHWYVDGVLIESTPTNSFNYTWPSSGTFELCIDASNDPCVPESDPPAPLCTTITVYDSDAGSLSVMPSPLCPNEIANISVTGYNMNPENAQAILITDQNGQIIEVINAATGTFTSPNCDNFLVYSYNYIPAIGTIPVVGDNVNNIDCAAECCDLENQPLSFEDNQPPTFPNAPANETFDCVDLVPPLTDLTWNDNCDGTGMAPGLENGSADVCSGGTITYRWDYTDACGNEASHLQTITVNPAPPPAFINPPADITVDCSSIPASGPNLDYTNNAAGACLIEGSVTPVESGSADICGGTISYTWEFTDLCNNVISHTQNVTVTPANPPQFINPPADITVDCANIPAGAPDLEYTNNESGSCLVTGFVSPVQSGSADLCGGTITYTWEFTDVCNNTIVHTQNITVTPVPPPAFVNPPASLTVSCDNIPSGAPDLNYTNNETGACLIAGTVSPTVSGSADICGGTLTYTWTVTDACNNTITHTQNITVTPANPPVFLNPPANMTVSCDNIPTGAPDLSYTNGESGSCLVEGTVAPTQSGSADNCGGTITYTWTFTDVCNNTITHTQNIIVTPPSPPVFLNPPGDMTVDCDNIPAGAPNLDYTNNESGSCLLTGSVAPTQSGSADLCGGSITYTWTFTDPCNNTIVHNQNITVTPVPTPSFVNPPADITVNCDNIPTLANAPDLNYTNNGVGACLISGTVAPTQVGSPNICGGTFSFVWQTTDPCGNPISYQQDITVIPATPPSFISPPSDITVDCNNAPTAPPNLNYSNNESGGCLIEGTVTPVQSGNVNPCGGFLTNTWTFTDQCNNTISHVQNITVLPAPPPVFTSTLPTDLTVNCDAVPANAPNLLYDNNAVGACQISGSIPAVQTGSFNECGGNLAFIWQFTDACGNSLFHQQNITVLPAPQPSFISPPGPITVNCADVASIPTSLSFTNGETGTCEISGSVPALETGIYDACGGTITYTWNYTDACLRTITHSQTIQVNPAADPIFLNPPPDLTINCGEAVPPPVDLVYSNNETGNCANVGIAFPTVQMNGLITTYNWSYSSPCNGNTITHTQVITENQAPDLNIAPIQELICQGDGFDLSTIAVTDLNNTNPTITFHSNTPATAANQLPSPVVNPFISTPYYILATNASGCTDEELFFLLIEDLPFAGIDGFSDICFNASFSVDLFSFLQGNPVQTGTWIDVDNTGADLSNPYNVDMSNIPPGIYEFDYEVPGTSVCPPDVATVTLELLPEIMVDVLAISCTADPDFYEVLINSNGFSIVNQGGTLNDLGNGQVSITDIPIDQTLVLIISNPTNFTCFQDLSITPPDCDCPTIDPPVNNGNAIICEGGLIPELSVSVSSDQTANWYGAASGGNLLLSGSLSYTPVDSTPGIYTYFVEALDTLTDCASSILTPVQFTINSNPNGSNATLELCDENGDGIETFDLSLAETQINTDPGLSFNYYENLPDAQNEVNELPVNFTNTISPQQTIFVVVTNALNCNSIVELDLIINPFPEVSLEIMNEICLNDSSGALNILSDTGNVFSFDTLIWTQDTFFNNLASGDYTLYVESAASCQITENFSILEGVELQLTEFEGICNDNGSSSDGSDDFYTIFFLAENNKANTGTFSIEEGGNVIGSYNYNQLDSLIFPALGQNLNFTFVDDSTGCSIEQASGPLNACSPDCLISIEQFTSICDNNGTTTDPLDDFYTINLDVSALNGASTGTYEVLLNGMPTYVFEYDSLYTFTLAADGSEVEVLVIDSESSDCQTTQVLSALNPCSTDCIISFDSLSANCSTNGTITNPADDFYEVIFMASAINPGVVDSFKLFAGSISQGIFSYDELHSINLPANGNVVLIEITDVTKTSCFNSQNIGPLEPCDEPCILSGSTSNIICDDNGTNTDPTDDNFFFELELNGQNTGSNWQSTDGSLSGTYDTLLTFGPLPISGGTINLDLEDDVTPGCIFTLQVDPPETCSDVCVLAIDTLEYACNDNGTLTDPSDDFYEFYLVASAINSGSQELYELFVDNTSLGIFSYGIGVSFTLPANGNTVEVFIQDLERTDCNVIELTQPLNTCDQQCTIEATVSNIICDDNGTGNDTLDDLFYFDLTVEGENTASGWQATNGLISGAYLNPDTYGPFLITDGILTLDLVDNITPTCVTSINVQPPLTCSSCSQNVDAGIGGTLTCTDTVIVLVATSSEPGVYSWTGPGSISSNTLEVNATLPGWYFFTATYADNCSFTDSVFIQEDVIAPLAEAGPSDTLNCVVTQIILDGSTSSQGANFLYNWTTQNGNILNGVNSLEPLIDDSGVYLLQVTSLDNGCTALDSVSIQLDTLKPVAIIAPTDTLNCETLSVNINASSSSSGSEFDYQWTTSVGNIVQGETNPTPIVNQPGIYILEITNVENGCSSSDSILVTEDVSVPLAIASAPGFLNCEVSELVLSSEGSSIGSDIIYTWTTQDGNFLAGEDTPSPTVNVPGTYQLLLTNSQNACTDSVTVFVAQDTVPPVSIVEVFETLDCENPSILLNGSTSSQSAQIIYEWSTNDGNFVAGTETLMPSIDQGGTYELLLTDTVNNCKASASIDIVPDTLSPQLSIIAPELLTCDVTTINLEAQANNITDPYELSWNTVNGNIVSGDTTAMPVIDTPGIYSVSIVNLINGCSDTATVSVDQDISTPDFSFDIPDTLSCSVNEIGLQAIVIGNENFEYAWVTQNGIIGSGGNSSSPIVSAPGWYVLTVENIENACTESDSLLVLQNITPPIANAGAADTLNCYQPEISLNGSASSQGTIYTYLWTTDNGVISSGETSLTPNINAVGDYDLFVTNTINGCSSTDQVTIFQDIVEPGAIATSPGILTCNDTTIILQGTTTVQGTALEYFWETSNGNIINGENSLNPEIDAPGIYTFNVLNSENGCTSMDSIEVDEDIESPIAIANADDSLSCFNTSLQLTGVGSSTGFEFIYSWTTQNGNILSGGSTLNPTVDSAGTYELLVTNTQNGCTHIAQVEVQDITEFPEVLIAEPEIMTCVLTEQMLDASASSTGPFLEYTWTTLNGNIISGAGTLNPEINEPGTYVLNIHNNQNGCETSDSVVVNQNIIEPDVDAGNAEDLTCVMTSQELMGNASGNSTNLSYQWSTMDGNIVVGANTLNPIIDQAGNYLLVVTDNENGCTNSDEVSVGLNLIYPNASIAPPAELNCDIKEVQLDATASSQGAVFSIEWSTVDGNFVTGQNTLTPVVDQAGTYFLLITNQDNGCGESADVLVTQDINQPQVDAGNPFTLPCFEDQLPLNGSVNLSSNEIQILWSTTNGAINSGSNTLNPQVSSAGIYSLNILNLNNGCEASDSVEVFQDFPRNLAAEPANPPCFGELGSIQITSIDGGTPPYEFSIDGGVNYFNGQQFNDLEPGLYTVYGRDANGCETSPIEINIEQTEEIQLVLEAAAELLLGETYQIEAQVNFPESEITFLAWTNSETLSCNDCLDPVASPLITTDYKLSIENGNGCPVSATIRVRVDERPDVYVPNAFSPNGDGVNDLFMIYARSEAVEKIRSFLVFDRWGESVHEYYNFNPNDPVSGWDGLFRGAYMNPQVFVWFAEIEFINGKVVLFEGDVTLVR